MDTKKRKFVDCVCTVCRKNFLRRTDHAAKYCSHHCSGIGRTKPHKACLICRKMFKSKFHHKKALFCSNGCSMESRKKRVIKSCFLCKKKVEKIPSQIKKKIFCGNLCCAKWLKKYSHGENSPRWKGDEIVNRHGYLWMRDGGGKYRQAHRMIMEKHLGRRLKSEEIVHHVNEIGTDNRIENLRIVSRAEHVRIHRPRRKDYHKHK